MALRSMVGTVGAWFIYALIRLFGRRHSPTDVGWLVGPVGQGTIGDRVYEETAAAEGLTLVRDAKEGGLIADFEALRGPGFDPDRVHPKIRDFYQRTPAYRLDSWATTYFPMRIALWALVSTISRRFQQLNFPLDGLATSLGMSSEIALLRAPDGQVRYTGWFRKLRRSGAVIYAGFYMTERPPRHDAACVKVVFPMPGGSATVILRPANDDAQGFRLESIGRGFGDAGFYRIQREGAGLRVWNITSLHETFALYVDEDQLVRCDHHVRFLGLPVLTLHYRIAPAAPA